MDMRCKNCTGQLVFDPKKQMLVCDNCGSVFSPAELGADQKDLLWDTKVESLSEIYGIDSPEFMDSYVYICKSCGGEIIINGTEASTKCLYCGNTAVVFSRIAKQKRPGFILPFKLTSDDAVKAVHEQFDKGILIPESIRNFKPDDVRGIYIPYWIVNCKHKGSVVVSGTVSRGKRTSTVYFGRAGKPPLEEVADEMLAIQADRDKFVDKHINRHAQEVINRMYAERRLDEEEEEE